MSTKEQLHDLDITIAEKLLGLEPCSAWKRQYGGWGMTMIGEPLWTKSYDDCEHGLNGCYPEGHPDRYSSEIRAAKLVEDEIDRRDLWYEYIAALIGYQDPTLIDIQQAWVLLRYSPEHRCRAALASVGEM